MLAASVAASEDEPASPLPNGPAACQFYRSVYRCFRPFIKPTLYVRKHIVERHADRWMLLQDQFLSIKLLELF